MLITMWIYHIGKSMPRNWKKPSGITKKKLVDWHVSYVWWMCTHTHTHTHTYTHRYICTYIHTYLYTTLQYQQLFNMLREHTPELSITMSLNKPVIKLWYLCCGFMNRNQCCFWNLWKMMWLLSYRFLCHSYLLLCHWM